MLVTGFWVFRKYDLNAAIKNDLSKDRSRETTHEKALLDNYSVGNFGE